MSSSESPGPPPLPLSSPGAALTMAAVVTVVLFILSGLLCFGSGGPGEGAVIALRLERDVLCSTGSCIWMSLSSSWAESGDTPVTWKGSSGMSHYYGQTMYIFDFKMFLILF